MCTSSETLDGLKLAALSNLDLSGYDPKVNPAYKDQLVAHTRVSVEGALVDSFDKSTSRLRCHGVLTFRWPDAILSRLNRAQTGVTGRPYSATATYEVRPQTAPDAYAYSLDRRFTAGLVTSVRPMFQALADADREKTDAKLDDSVGIG
jgi:hypothetical protein